MKLTDILKNIKIIKQVGLADFDVKGITDNSKQVKSSFIFVAVPGEKFDGSNFIQEAVDRGAGAVIIQPPATSHQPPVKKISFIEVKDAREALAQLADNFYGHPSQYVKCIGITGTNGKTTITYLLENIFKQAGFKCGVVGTINYHFGNIVIAASNTTPNAVYLQSLLSRMRQAKINYCAIEVSSHSLEQRRVEGIVFHYAVFTNLTSDHLDYHNNRHYYFMAKAKLFKMLNKDSFAIINIDDAYGKKIAKITKGKIVTYAINKKADIQAKNIRLGWEETEFRIKVKKRSFIVKTKLIGRHNIYNILSAVALALKEKISLEDIRKGVYNLSKVDGRLERVACPNGFSVFVDYAHTEDALKNVLCSLRNIGLAQAKSAKMTAPERRSVGREPGKLITVFGCGGDRDRTKRPKMGMVASSLSDRVIITSDNPRSEAPQKIAEEVLSGVSIRHMHKVEIVLNRYKAIEKAIALAGPCDVVLIAGKGHEQQQIFKDKIIRFDDREVVSEILEKYE